VARAGSQAAAEGRLTTRNPPPPPKEEARRRQVPQLARIDSALARPQSWDHEAPDQRAAEAEAVKLFGLSEEQRKRPLILERD
jgi:hypothetical protein